MLWTETRFACDFLNVLLQVIVPKESSNSSKTFRILKAKGEAQSVGLWKPSGGKLCEKHSQLELSI